MGTAEDYIYHLAAMAAAKTGDLDQAITWLKEAVERGWQNLPHTQSRDEFQPLKSFPEWQTIHWMITQNQEKKP